MGDAETEYFRHLSAPCCRPTKDAPGAAPDTKKKMAEARADGLVTVAK